MREVILFLEPKGTILEVVRAAKRRGLFVIAAVSDRNLLNLAPRPYREALSDIDAIVDVPSWESPEIIEFLIHEASSFGGVRGVYSGVDPCAVVSAKLRTHFGLPTPSAEAMSLILNKFQLRTQLRQQGLSNLRSFPGSAVDSWKTWEMVGPAYFKPVRGFFSAYVRRCETLADLEKAKKEWREGGATDTSFVINYIRSVNDYHLEEAFDGELLSVEGITSGGKLRCLGLLSRILYSKDPVVEMGSCFPYQHPLSEKIISLVERAHMALGFSEGPSHTEVIVNKSGKIEIIDFNPRFVGADVLQSINNAFGIHIEEILLDWALGLPVKFTPRTSLFSCLQYVLPPKALTFEKLEMPEVPEVRFRTSFLEPGAKVSSIGRQLDYLGCYLTVMPGFDEAIRRSRELRNVVRVNGILEGEY